LRLRVKGRLEVRELRLKLIVSCACWGVKVLQEPRRHSHPCNRLWSKRIAQCGFIHATWSRPVADAGRLNRGPPMGLNCV